MTDTTPIINKITPSAAPPWAQLIILLVTSYAAYLHGNSVVPPNPTPVPPNVIPAPTPPFKGSDGKDGKTPVPTPPKPSNAILVSDTRGGEITGGVDAGQLFYVSCQEGNSVTGYVQPGSTSGDVDKLSATKLVCTLKSGGRLQVFAYGSGEPTTMMIVCNQGAQPPPTPVVDPTPQPKPIVDPNPPKPPTPVPVPVPVQNRKVVISIVEDGLNRSPQTAAMLNNIKAWDAFLVNGNQWIRYDKQATESKGVAAKNALAAAGITTLPAVVINDQESGAVVYTGQLTSMDPIKSFVNMYTGSNL